MSEQDNVRLVKEAYEDYKRGDIAALVKKLSDDVEWITPGPPDSMPAAGRRHGREGVKEFFSTLSNQEEVELFDVKEFIAQGDKVVALSKYRGRVRATGLSAEADLVHVFEIKDGKVKRFQEYFDTASVLPAFTSAKAASAKASPKA